MGGAALMQGFALIGFETWPDADETVLQEVLTELLRERQRALLLLEPRLARCDCAPLRIVLNEGGRIVVSEIPPLDAPERLPPGGRRSAGGHGAARHLTLWSARATAIFSTGTVGQGVPRPARWREPPRRTQHERNATVETLEQALFDRPGGWPRSISPVPARRASA